MIDDIISGMNGLLGYCKKDRHPKSGKQEIPPCPQSDFRCTFRLIGCVRGKSIVGR